MSVNTAQSPEIGLPVFINQVADTLMKRMGVVDSSGQNINNEFLNKIVKNVSSILLNKIDKTQAELANVGASKGSNFLQKNFLPLLISRSFEKNICDRLEGLNKKQEELNKVVTELGQKNALRVEISEKKSNSSKNFLEEKPEIPEKVTVTSEEKKEKASPPSLLEERQRVVPVSITDFSEESLKKLGKLFGTTSGESFLSKLMGGSGMGGGAPGEGGGGGGGWLTGILGGLAARFALPMLTRMIPTLARATLSRALPAAARLLPAAGGALVIAEAGRRALQEKDTLKGVDGGVTGALSMVGSGVVDMGLDAIDYFKPGFKESITGEDGTATRMVAKQMKREDSQVKAVNEDYSRYGESSHASLHLGVSWGADNPRRLKELKYFEELGKRKIESLGYPIGTTDEHKKMGLQYIGIGGLLLPREIANFGEGRPVEETEEQRRKADRDASRGFGRLKFTKEQSIKDLQKVLNERYKKATHGDQTYVEALASNKDIVQSVKASEKLGKEKLEKFLKDPNVAVNSILQEDSKKKRTVQDYDEKDVRWLKEAAKAEMDNKWNAPEPSAPASSNTQQNPVPSTTPSTPPIPPAAPGQRWDIPPPERTAAIPTIKVNVDENSKSVAELKQIAANTGTNADNMGRMATAINKLAEAVGEIGKNNNTPVDVPKVALSQTPEVPRPARTSRGGEPRIDNFRNLTIEEGRPQVA